MSANPAIIASAPTVLPSTRPNSKALWTTTASMIASDCVALAIICWAAVVGRHLITPTYSLISYFEMLPCLIGLLLGAFWFQGLYPGVLIHATEEMRRIFFSVTTVFLLLSSTTFLWRNGESYSRSVLLITWAASFPFVLLSRFVVRRALAQHQWWGIPAVVLGSGKSAERVVRSLNNGLLGVKVVGALSDDLSAPWPEDLPPILGDLNSASALASSGAALYAIVAMPENSQLELRHVIQDYCRGFFHVLFVPDMPWLCSQGISARELGGEIGFELPQRLVHRSAAIVKRSFDLILAGSAVTLGAPLLALITIAVKLSSPGPVFYGQSRYGRRGKTFKALKFRTMVPNADRILAEYLAAHPEYLFEWQRDHKLKDDPRVTRLGKWLRRFSLDELPQLVNVLAGQMSLVGPRPIVHAEIEKYGRGYGLYTRVRPGITGLWQVSGRNNTTYQERVTFDEYYVRNWSIWLDAYILIRTVEAVVSAKGAY